MLLVWIELILWYLLLLLCLGIGLVDGDYDIGGLVWMGLLVEADELLDVDG